MLKTNDLVFVKSFNGNKITREIKWPRIAVVTAVSERFAGGYNVSIDGIYVNTVAWYSSKDMIKLGSGFGWLNVHWSKKRKLHFIKNYDIEYFFKKYNDKYKITMANWAVVKDYLGIEGNLWGPQGEGVYLWSLTQHLWEEVSPFLENNDLEGFLEHARKYREVRGFPDPCFDYVEKHYP